MTLKFSCSKRQKGFIDQCTNKAKINKQDLKGFPFLVCIFQAQHRDAFVQDRYGQYDLSDPFLALQRDSESEERQRMLTQPSTHLQGRAVGPNPLAVLKLVMAHCKRMQERMTGQLAAAESRHKRVNITSVRPYFQVLSDLLQFSCFKLAHCNNVAPAQGPSQCQTWTLTDSSHTQGKCGALLQQSSRT